MLNHFILISALPFILAGCSPGVLSTIDDIATQEAVSLTLDKEAFQKDTDVRISVEVINKDPAPQAPAAPASSK